MRFPLFTAIVSALLTTTVAGQQRPAQGGDIVKVTLDQNLRTTVNGVSVQRYPNLKELFLSMPKPSYPPGLRRRHMTGSGIFRMNIDENGRVTNVNIRQSTGHRELDAQATNALMRWRTKPGARREIDMPITFTNGH
jgi:TonB family protein